MDINIEHRSPPDFELQQAFLVYKSTSDSRVVVTRNQIKDHRVLPGGFVEPPEFIANRHKYWIQPGDVYRDNKTYVFMTPPRRVTQHFSGGAGRKVKVWSETERHPQYMWAVQDGNLYVWRFRKHKDDYMLLSPRLWNVSENGHVCAGTMPKPDITKGRKAMEDFWESAFSHALTQTHNWKGRLSTWLASRSKQ